MVAVAALPPLAALRAPAARRCACTSPAAPATTAANLSLTTSPRASERTTQGMSTAFVIAAQPLAAPIALAADDRRRGAAYPAAPRSCIARNLSSKCLSRGHKTLGGTFTAPVAVARRSALLGCRAAASSSVEDETEGEGGGGAGGNSKFVPLTVPARLALAAVSVPWIRSADVSLAPPTPFAWRPHTTESRARYPQCSRPSPPQSATPL